MWAIDCVVDRDDLTNATLQSSLLHAKYLAMLMQVKARMIKLGADAAQMKAFKTRYYNGEVTKTELDELDLSQYQGLRPLKADMVTKLDGDPDVSQIKMKIQYSESLVYQLESILHSIKGRDWAVRNFIQWKMFEAGH